MGKENLDAGKQRSTEKNQYARKGQFTRNTQNQRRNGYIGAPYNFVPIAKNIYKRYQKEQELPQHNKMDVKRYSGELICRIDALTDIFIGGGKEVKQGEYSDFAQCIDGTPCIPGSSLKGLVRSNMQVLGFGAIAGDVEDYNIMYRYVGAAKSRVSRYYTDSILNVKSVLLGKDRKGNQIRTTIPKNVKAGYIKKEGNSYVIYPTEVDKIDQEKFGECNYYPISEREVFWAKEEAENQGKENPFSFFEDLGIQMQHKNDCNSSDFTIEKIKGRIHVKGPESQCYVPYMAEILYSLNGNRKVVSILKPDGECPEGYKIGYVISTGKMKEKKVFYVIPKRRDGSGITIPESDLLSFQQDYENKKNKLHGTLKDDSLREKCKSFFALPEGDEAKPVFYAERGGRVYFGYTPFLRIFYEHSILCGISKEQREYMKANGDLKKPVLDYPSSLLGYATDQGSYKSRVCFEDFRLQVPEGMALEQYLKEKQYGLEMIQGEPKLSSYWDYLVQDNPEHAMTYNEDNFELRGIKQYWLHKKVKAVGEAKNQDAASRFLPLKSGVSFGGKVRFQNLSEDELGLLIWSLSLETDSNQNIGRAKSFGYGRIGLSLEQLSLYDYEKMYGTHALCMDVFDNKTAEDINDFISSYKDYMNQNYKKTDGLPYDIMKEQSIDAFTKMKDKNNMPDEKSIAYMSLDSKDYQNRNRPLHTIKQVLDRETPSAIEEEKKNGTGYKGNYKASEGEKEPTMAGLFENIKLN